MKRWIIVLLSFVMLINMAACGSKTENVAPMEEPSVSENSDEVLTQKSEEVHEEQPEEESELAAPENEEKLPQDIVGIWSSEDGLQADGTAEYHNYYICLFENGMTFHFGWRVL